MGAKMALSVEQYLRASFPDQDKEYRDGEVVERSVLLREQFPLHALYLIPDVAVFYPETPGEVPGVPHVWLVDPYSKRFYTCDDGFAEAQSLTIHELGVELTSSVIFQGL
jgi:hypothetical protein